MVDKVQAKANFFGNALFHFCLIRLLVLEELKKKDLDWEYFLLQKSFSVEVVDIPHAKKKTPSLVHKYTQTRAGSSKENKGKGKKAGPRYR